MKKSSLISIALASAALAVPATAQAAFPSATTGAATHVTFSSATLSGTVNPHGAATNYYFQYGLTKTYSATTPLTPAGSGNANVPASEPLSGLNAATTYHYRIVAAGPAQSTRGEDRTFKTPAIPLSLQIGGVPNPALFGTPFTVVGTLSGTGNANQVVVLQTLTNGAWVNTPANAEVTTPTGTFSFPFVSATSSAQYRVVTQGNPPVISALLIEGVAVRVNLHVRTVHHPGRARFLGSVSPAQVGAGVTLQRVLPHGRLINVAGTTVRSNSTFSLVAPTRHHGVYRVFVAATGGYAPNFSNEALIR